MRVVFPGKSCPLRFTCCLIIQEQDSSGCGQTVILCDTANSYWFRICCCPCRNQYQTWLDLLKERKEITYLSSSLGQAKLREHALYSSLRAVFQQVCTKAFTSWRLPMSDIQLECKQSNLLLRAGWWPRHGVSLTKKAESKCTLPLADVGVDNWCRHVANTALLNWKENFSVLPTKGDLFELNDQREERWDNAAFLNISSAWVAFTSPSALPLPSGFSLRDLMTHILQGCFPFYFTGNRTACWEHRNPFLQGTLTQSTFDNQKGWQVCQKHLLSYI